MKKKRNTKKNEEKDLGYETREIFLKTSKFKG
jgi:hypothetical protein